MPETVLQKVGSENLNWRAGSFPEKITGATIGVHANPAHHGHALSLRVALLLLLLLLPLLLLPLLIHAIPHSHILPPNALLNVVHMLLVQEPGA